MTSRAEIASLFNIMRPENASMEPWVAALRSGDYRFGYGVLRDGDENYDPLGVLAAINFVDWSWDASEGCWAIDGRTDVLRGELILTFLGCRRMDGSACEAAEAFGLAITTLNDSCTNFTNVYELLTRAIVDSESQRTRMRLAQEETRELRRGPLLGEVNSRDVIRGSFYRYGR